MALQGAAIFAVIAAVATFVPGGLEGARAIWFYLLMTIAGAFLGIGVERFRD